MVAGEAGRGKLGHVRVDRITRLYPTFGSEVKAEKTAGSVCGLPWTGWERYSMF
jgi:hypothetical protein